MARIGLRKAQGAIVAALLIGAARSVFLLARLLGPDRSADFGGFLARKVGPRLKPHKTALANLKAAFPEMAEAERERIALAAWDNLGRTGGEYPHLAKLMDYDHENPSADGRVEVTGIEHFAALRDDGKPGIIFASHLANWELPAIVAARHGLAVTAVFRAPNDPASRRLVEEVRRETMGGLEASRSGVAFVLREVLEQGGHLGALIDQHFSRGVETPFLGRPALTNPLLGKLARQFDCPVHGVRVMRLPGHRFRIELTPPLDLPRDDEGLIDQKGAMAAMTAVIEGWVRETPEQWLWMHRRWRTSAKAK